MSHICPACEEGILSLAVGDRTIIYNGKEVLVPQLEFAVCPICEEQVVLSEQERGNERKFVDARKKADGLLTSVELVEFRERWGLTQAIASQIFGGGVNAFSRYERCEVVQSQSADLLMRLIDRNEDVRRFISQRFGVRLQNKFEDQWVDDDDHATLRSVVVNKQLHEKLAKTARQFGNIQDSRRWKDQPGVRYG